MFFDRKLLALHLATQHFRFFLKGRSFTTYIDHKPLTFTMSKVSDPWSTRQQCQLAAISEFTTNIQHVAGKSNLDTDCLSRALASPIYVGDDYATMAAEQCTDPDVLADRPHAGRHASVGQSSMFAVHRAPFLSLAPCTTTYKTFLSRGRWALLVSFLFSITPISPTCVHFMTACFGLLNQVPSIFYWISGDFMFYRKLH